MKTKNCICYLAETNEQPNIGDVCINIIQAFVWKEEHVKHNVIKTLPEYRNTKAYKLFLVSLDNDVLQEGDMVIIEDDDVMIDFVRSIYPDGSPKLENRVVSDNFTIMKVIAEQDKLSEEFIIGFVENYNNGLNFKEIQIEMIDVDICKKCDAIHSHDYGYHSCRYPNCGGELYHKYEPKLTNGYITVIEKEYSHNLLCNMQYYMEYCQMNGYVTPHDWLNIHKQSKDEKEEANYTEQQLKQAFYAGAAYATGSFKEFKQIHPNYDEWLKTIKK